MTINNYPDKRFSCTCQIECHLADATATHGSSKSCPSMSNYKNGKDCENMTCIHPKLKVLMLHLFSVSFEYPASCLFLDIIGKIIYVIFSIKIIKNS